MIAFDNPAGDDYRLAAKVEVTTAKYKAAMCVTNRTAKNCLHKLGLLRMKGAGRATRYESVRT